MVRSLFVHCTVLPLLATPYSKWDWDSRAGLIIRPSISLRAACHLSFLRTTWATLVGNNISCQSLPCSSPAAYTGVGPSECAFNPMRFQIASQPRTQNLCPVVFRIAPVRSTFSQRTSPQRHHLPGHFLCCVCKTHPSTTRRSRFVPPAIASPHSDSVSMPAFCSHGNIGQGEALRGETPQKNRSSGTGHHVLEA
jgi:hypothetical protein